MDGRFTDEELVIAKSVDLCAVAESLGYTVKRIGKYHTLKEMDSIRIYNRSHWYRWSRQFDKGNNGEDRIIRQLSWLPLSMPRSSKSGPMSMTS